MEKSDPKQVALVTTDLLSHRKEGEKAPGSKFASPSSKSGRGLSGFLCLSLGVKQRRAGFNERLKKAVVGGGENRDAVM